MENQIWKEAEGYADLKGVAQFPKMFLSEIFSIYVIILNLSYMTQVANGLFP